MALRRSTILVGGFCHRAVFSRAQSTIAITPKITLKKSHDDDHKSVVVLFTWLGANHKTSMKYVDCWAKRGHNVLLVKTPVKDLLCPKTGTNVTAADLIDYLNIKDQTPLIFHGLSVGGYLTQKVLMTSSPVFHDRITHVIYDSFTSVEGFEAGVLQVTPSTLKSLISTCIRSYFRVADLSSFNEAQHYVLSSDSPTPTYFLHSKADAVAPITVVQQIIEARKRYAPVETFICPENLQIPHVSILKHLGEKAYMDLILNFVAKHRV